MLVKTDENLHPQVASVPRRHGHDAITVWDQGLRGRPDEDLIEMCRREARVLITLDIGFADIRKYPPEQFRGLIILRVKSQSRAHVLATVERLVPLLESEPISGTLWIVSEKGIRIHGKDE